MFFPLTPEQPVPKPQPQPEPGGPLVQLGQKTSGQKTRSGDCSARRSGKTEDWQIGSSAMTTKTNPKDTSSGRRWWVGGSDLQVVRLLVLLEARGAIDAYGGSC